jgi:hypothetical protein
MTRDYRQYLRSIGRKPIRGEIRTAKAADTVEIAWDARVKDYVGHVHEGEQPEAGNVVTFKRVRRA